jgi:uncharacterized protein
MIKRIAEARLIKLANTFRSVAVVGPRQSGKTTLCKMVFPNKPYVSFENPDTLAFAFDDPRGFLAQFSPDQGAILDEIQKVPHLFSFLQQILDETQHSGLFILSGSNNFLLQENITQTLAGRVAYVQLLPLSLEELKENGQLQTNYPWHLVHGGYPEVISKNIDPNDWYPNYISTYIERDVRQLKNITNLNLFANLLRLCAGRTGQLLNLASLSNDCGIDQKTVSAWLSVMQSSYIVYFLKPYFHNFNKRVIKSPKLYFYDTGVACALLGIRTQEQLASHPAKGALFENLILSELLKSRFNTGIGDNLFFWRDKTGNEVDIISDDAGQLTAIELKAGATISEDFFKGLNYFSKIEATVAEKLVIYGGDQVQHRSNGLKVKPWNQLT